MRQLEEQGLALNILGSVNAQSFSGVICTGIHGTEKNFNAWQHCLKALK